MGTGAMGRQVYPLRTQRGNNRELGRAWANEGCWGLRRYSEEEKGLYLEYCHLPLCLGCPPNAALIPTRRLEILSLNHTSYQ